MIITNRTYGGLAAVCGAVFCFAMAIAYCTGCGGTFQKDAQVVDRIVMPITKAVCEVAADVTPPPAGWVDVVCSWAEGVEASIADAPPASGVALGAATVKAPASIRMRLSVPRAKQLAAAYPSVLVLPKGM